MPDPIGRFWVKVAKGDGCWEWTGATNAHGYGWFWTGRKNMGAHRFSAMLHFGMFDRRVVVCHTCDNRKCVRPEHLVLADHKWNAEDRESKGRGADARKTHCPGGHAYSPDNTYVTPSNGSRCCRTCRADRDAARSLTGDKREKDRAYQRARYESLKATP